MGVGFRRRSGFVFFRFRGERVRSGVVGEGWFFVGFRWLLFRVVRFIWCLVIWRKIFWV